MWPYWDHMGGKVSNCHCSLKLLLNFSTLLNFLLIGPQKSTVLDVWNVELMTFHDFFSRFHFHVGPSGSKNFKRYSFKTFDFFQTSPELTSQWSSQKYWFFFFFWLLKFWVSEMLLLPVFILLQPNFMIIVVALGEKMYHLWGNLPHIKNVMTLWLVFITQDYMNFLLLQF